MEPVSINLATFRYVDRRLSFLVVLLALFTVAAVTGFNFLSYSRGKEEIHRFRGRIALLKEARAEKEKRAVKRETVDAEALARVQMEKRIVNRLILLDGFPWPEILDRLERSVLPGITLGSLSHSDDFSRLSLGGRAEAAAQMTGFIRQLGSGELFVKNELSSLSFVPLGKGGGISFSITGLLNMKGFPVLERHRELLSLPNRGER